MVLKSIYSSFLFIMWTQLCQNELISPKSVNSSATMTMLTRVIDIPSNQDLIPSSVPGDENPGRIRHLCSNTQYSCENLPGYCLTCDFNFSCIYGSIVTVHCRPSDGVFCKLPTDSNNNETKSESYSTSPTTTTTDDAIEKHTPYTITKSIKCRYCHQLEDTEMVCLGRINCRQPNVPRSYYETRCEPLPHLLCLGRRVFRRMVPCNWSSGKSYITAVLLSLFLGGLGVDRFYLGMWVEGLGKLFSFGGLGVWSIVDFILILSGYVKPSGDNVYW